MYVLILGKYERDYMKATQLYRERFSDRRHPSNVEIRNYEFNVRKDILINIVNSPQERFSLTRFSLDH